MLVIKTEVNVNKTTKVARVLDTRERVLFESQSGKALENLKQWFELMGIDGENKQMPYKSTIGEVHKDNWVLNHYIELAYFDSVDKVPTDAKPCRIHAPQYNTSSMSTLTETMCFVHIKGSVTRVYVPLQDSDIFQELANKVINSIETIPVLQLRPVTEGVVKL
ncbi:hypothetical protein [Bacillus toyonensis]|uniref:hypothetical protein n=1 Tax=Bacillus toyonensis TaxID=155322 RepID=UPI000BF36FC7|nr:hypothetical protein [Bacillus toyonensis]PGF04958.1 hypothetical protein COM61_00520 [Bacillus toyonensis]